MNETLQNMPSNVTDQVSQLVGGYLPNLLGALAILAIGWLVALVVAAVVRGALHRTTIDNRLAAWMGASQQLELLYGCTYVGDVLTRIGLRAGGETLPTYDLHNLSASVSKDDWRLTFYADNLLDEYAVTGVRQTPGQIGVTEDGVRARRYFATCWHRGGWARASATPSTSEPRGPGDSSAMSAPA